MVGQMQNIFKKLQALDETPNHTLIDAYNQHVARQNFNYRLIVNTQVRPCFFSGDLETPGKVVTISLNPAYTPQVTEAEQAGMNFAEWYYYCRFRFNHYASDAAVHTIFKNLFKVIAPPTLWSGADKRLYLQEHLLNLDWCCYYSEQFPSFALAKLPNHLQRSICDAWDTNLYWLIEQAAPRAIFVHGQAMQDWVSRSAVDLKPVMQLTNSRRQPCQFFQGRLAGTAIPFYYLEHFINVVNQNTTLERINRFINENR